MVVQLLIGNQLTVVRTQVGQERTMYKFDTTLRESCLEADQTILDRRDGLEAKAER